MNSRDFDPAFDYDTHGGLYSALRTTDPEIASQLWGALGDDIETVINVGAGTGSYEPPEKYVISVEPSARMRAQRIEIGRPPAINASAEALPFDDDSFDAAMAVLTVHHWRDLDAGLAELRRVSRRRALIMSFDPEKLDLLWNSEYFPEVLAVERRRYPPINRIAKALGGTVSVIQIEVPLTCVDGFQEGFYGRPEAFLDARVRRNQSAWGFVDPAAEAREVAALQADLESGEWDRKHGHLRNQPTFRGALRLVVTEYR